ncbi:phosphonate ABC transporter, permease protein PhnE [Rhizobium mongolense]|uniref:Phosphonate transport system permease protein n=1 Tax=Rhizobium mongolense TaxID=57676 RepID=A0A7W6RI95_9HYPH|nr:phosphonate ABC transporter, permease protein PhnE [Rhizobium mongolense]MBB4272889.1 phosphonate transport system permease protein [Rhizobium mongolense]
MSDTALRHPPSETASMIERHWHELASRRRGQTFLALFLVVVFTAGSVWFANETNAGKFWDRLPYLADFVGDLVPRDAWEPARALLDLPSPYYDGSQKYDYPEGRFYVTQTLYVPEYVQKIVETVNIAIFSTGVGFCLGFALCFFAARNMMPNAYVRGAVRRFMEILRAFPEVVIAGFCLAILSLGPVPAIIALSVHTTGALGKMFFEVVENADMRPDEGLRAVGATWLERVWFGMVPQVMPNFVSYFLLRLEINVRASTIIGAVGGGGIGELLRLSIGQGHPAKTLAIVFLLFCTIIAVDQFSAWLRRKLVGEQSFRAVA